MHIYTLAQGLKPNEKQSIGASWVFFFFYNSVVPGSCVLPILHLYFMFQVFKIIYYFLCPNTIPRTAKNCQPSTGPSSPFILSHSSALGLSQFRVHLTTFYYHLCVSPSPFSATFLVVPFASESLPLSWSPMEKCSDLLRQEHTLRPGMNQKLERGLSSTCSEIMQVSLVEYLDTQAAWKTWKERETDSYFY